uniref:Uncharacterized protein n=1 Tax=viral metagenome TaxID=1070528 RepID=A0A6C0AFI8_9ZZZZ
MLEVLKKDIPEWLRETEFYMTLDNETSIMINEKHFNFDPTNINN